MRLRTLLLTLLLTGGFWYATSHGSWNLRGLVQPLTRDGCRFLSLAKDFFDERHLLASEQTLEKAGFLGLDKTQRTIATQETRHHIGVGLGDVGAFQMNRRRT